MGKKTKHDFKALRAEIKAKLALLNAPNVKQTEHVINARKNMEAMLELAAASCFEMYVEIETDGPEDAE